MSRKLRELVTVYRLIATNDPRADGVSFEVSEEYESGRNLIGTSGTPDVPFRFDPDVIEHPAVEDVTDWRGPYRERDGAFINVPAGAVPVVVESPYAGDTAANLAYLRALIADCLERGEAPVASHKLYTDVLPDVGDHRRLGIEAGFALMDAVLAAGGHVVVGEDRGRSSGVRAAIVRARNLSAVICYRHIADRIRGGDVTADRVAAMGWGLDEEGRVRPDANLAEGPLSLRGLS